MATTKQRGWTRKFIFKTLEDAGFHPIDIKFGNSYFIFDHGKDMIVHFHIKELKGWKFGIWWDIEGDKKFDLFTQYERDIDKFKPSASTLVLEEIPLYDWDMKLIVQMCNFIKKHPYRAWALDQTYSSKIWEWDYLNGCFRDYWKQWWTDSVYYPFVHERLRKRYLKIIDQIFDESKLINARVIDNNKGGWISYPRYDFVCDGIVGEKTEPGNWEISFEGNFSKKLVRRIQKFNKSQKKIRKKYHLADDLELGNSLVIRVIDKKKKGKK